MSPADRLENDDKRPLSCAQPPQVSRVLCLESVGDAARAAGIRLEISHSCCKILLFAGHAQQANRVKQVVAAGRRDEAGRNFGRDAAQVVAAVLNCPA